ncbi:SREBP regulating gene protein-like [Schistocerca gregaria]|uniref:SREBP regulating gene protein-like n=1 Tax=Schistocerca gregaria TaxID=7010 RepID=UPI00211E72D5|nr:SREBP regulating gene protein-like [Schistocerca gregaria]
MFKLKLQDTYQRQIQKLLILALSTGLLGLCLFFFFSYVRVEADVIEYNIKLLNNIRETLNSIKTSNSTFSRSIYKKDVCKYTSLNWEWIVDSNGNVCRYGNIHESTNCCLTDGYIETNDSSSSPKCDKRYECCALYEFCISCCLEATWSTLFLKFQKNKFLLDKFLFIQGGLPKDVFDFCIAKCRTNSNSVVHENEFRSKWKYCYGNKPAPLTVLPLRKR